MGEVDDDVVDDDVVDPVLVGLEVEVEGAPLEGVVLVAAVEVDGGPLEGVVLVAAVEVNGAPLEGVVLVACTEAVTVLGATLSVAAPSGPDPACRAAGSMWALWAVVDGSMVGVGSCWYW